MNNHYQSGGEGFKVVNVGLDYRSWWFFTDKDGQVWTVPPVIAPNDYGLLLDTDEPGNAIYRSAYNEWFPKEKNRRDFKIYRPVSTISLAGRSFGQYYSKYDGKNIYYGIICCDQNPRQFGQTLVTSDKHDWRMSYSGAISGWGETLYAPRDALEENIQRAYSFEVPMSDGAIKGNAIVPYVRRFAWYFVYSEDDSEIPEWCKQNCEEVDFAYVTKGKDYDCFLPDIEKFHTRSADNQAGLYGCNIRELQEYGCFKEVAAAIPNTSANYLLSGIRGWDKLNLNDDGVQDNMLSGSARILRFENYNPLAGNYVFTPWYNLGITGSGDDADNYGTEAGAIDIGGTAFSVEYNNGFNYGCLRNPVEKSNETKIEMPKYGYRSDVTFQNMCVTSDATVDDINDVVFKYCDAGCPVWIYSEGDQRFISPTAIHGNFNMIGSAPSIFGVQQMGLGSMLAGRGSSIELPPHVDAYNLPHGRFFLTIDNHIDNVKLVKDFTFVERANNEQS